MRCPARIRRQNIGLGKSFSSRRQSGLRGHDDPPVPVIAADIFHQQGFGVMKQQHAAQPILGASIANQFGMASGIANRNSEMMVGATHVVRHPGLRAGKDKDAGFAISAHFVFDEYGPAFWSIHHHAGENALCGSALCHGTGGVENVHGRVLVATDIAKRQSGNPTARNALKIERAPATREDLDGITACAGQEYRPIGQKDFVFIHAWPNKDLVGFAGLFQGRARPGILCGILPIHNQRPATERIRRRILSRRF